MSSRAIAQRPAARGRGAPEKIAGARRLAGRALWRTRRECPPCVLGRARRHSWSRQGGGGGVAGARPPEAYTRRGAGLAKQLGGDLSSVSSKARSSEAYPSTRLLS